MCIRDSIWYACLIHSTNTEQTFPRGTSASAFGFSEGIDSAKEGTPMKMCIRDRYRGLDAGII